jgi:hypothetical protein
MVEVLPANAEQQQHKVKVVVTKLLHEFKDVFSQPKTLPPTRANDHVVPLLPNSIPVNSKPYRYPLTITMK